MRGDSRRRAAGGLTSPVWLFAAVLVVGLFLLQVSRFWHPVYGFTRFLQLDATNDDTKIAAFKTNPVYVYRDTGGYDGLYYAQIAYHPTLRNPELAPSVDSLSYRARRILPPALAWILAAGQAAWIAQVYSGLNIAAWLALAAVLWRLLSVADLRGFIAWCGLLGSAGALGSVRYALTDLIALALLALAMALHERGRRVSMTGFMAAAALSRETSVLALAGVIEKPWLSRRNGLVLALAITPLALWLAYIRWQLGPAEPGLGNFTTPFSGAMAKLIECVRDVARPGTGEVALAWSTLAATLGILTQAAFFVSTWRRRDAWWHLGAAYVVLMTFLAHAVWEGFPGAFTRVLLPLALAFNVIAVRRRAALWWLVAGNLSVFSGLIMITDVHYDTRELAAARLDGTPIVATLGQGWSGVERLKRRTWSWSQQESTLLVQSWSQDSRRVIGRCTVRSLTARQVTLLQDGKTLWRGSVGPVPAPVTFSFELKQGAARLNFSSDQPGVPEQSNGTGRRLAFAVYDVRLQLPEDRP